MIVYILIVGLFLWQSRAKISFTFMLPILFLSTVVQAIFDYDKNHYFAVKTNAEYASQISKQFGFEFHGQIGELQNYFMYSTPIDIVPEHHIQKRLESSSMIEWVSKQVPKQRLFKRDLIEDVKKSLNITDPGLKYQWHLVIDLS